MTEWLKGNKICNATLCTRFEELIGQGMTQRQAAKELEREQQEKWGTVLYGASTLRRRYQKAKGGWRPSEVLMIPQRDERGRFLKGVATVPLTRRGKPRSAPPRTFTMAMDFATMAIGHLSRITYDDPNWPQAMYRVRKWINEFIEEGRKKNGKKGQR
jgi:hypothetical protein